VATDKPLHDQLAVSAFHFVRKRESPSKLRDTMVEKRDTTFKADAHRRAIHFGQNVAGQIGNQIEVHHLLDEVHLS